MEIRDPVHVFIKLDESEKRLISSRSFQRLRNIHQLALTFYIYPGASHKRFEHSLGVMELAGRIFDVLINNASDEDFSMLSPTNRLNNTLARGYWRRVVRMAALCHDLGHLPFSHAAEAKILPEGRSHEDISYDLIHSEELENIWKTEKPPLDPEDIAKIALGPKEYSNYGTLNQWEQLLSDIITNDFFGADRMDYLLRDSHYAGVPFGKFDYVRLIDCLRLLSSQDDGSDSAPQIGVLVGGIHSIEALILARYFMYKQVYYHPVRKAFDKHLAEYMSNKYQAVDFQDRDYWIQFDDYKLFSDMRASVNGDSEEAEYARRILERDHFKLVYRHDKQHIRQDMEKPEVRLAEGLIQEFGEENVKHLSELGANRFENFYVQEHDERIMAVSFKSDILERVPDLNAGFVWMKPELRKKGLEFADSFNWDA